MKEKRKLVARIRKGLHPPVSKMSREQIIQYIYGTAREQNVNWEPYFDGAMQKKRVPKSCYRMSGPGHPQPRKGRLTRPQATRGSKRRQRRYRATCLGVHLVNELCRNPL